MPFYDWSQTSSNNATFDPTINWAEGQAPSSINDSARAMMARLREWGNDIAGAIVTSGTSTAYTVSSNQVFDTLAHLAAQVIAFTPHVTNAAGSPSVTLSVDGLAAKPVRTAPNVDLLSGVLIQGTPYAAVYNNSDGAFYLFGVGSAPGIPLGGLLDFIGSTTPSSAFVFPAGQAISRTTYATLFALIGTTYGTGDGSTTFNVPDATGRVTAMKEATATRLTSTYFGANSTSLGAAGGSQDTTLITANLPPYTPSGTIANGSTDGTKPILWSTAAVSSAVAGGTTGGTSSPAVTFLQAGISVTSGAFTGTAQGGTSTPIATVQPTIIVNKILRII